MPQMSPLFWVFLLIIFTLIYSFYLITFYFKYFHSLNLFQPGFLNSSKFFLVFDK